jgi:hypothetical protein
MAMKAWKQRKVCRFDQQPTDTCLQSYWLQAVPRSFQ